MLVCRLKSILAKIISHIQSAFVPGRLIVDNILVAYECVHKIKNKRDGQAIMCVVKLDMQNAYYRMEWVFLENTMLNWDSISMGEFNYKLCVFFDRHSL